MVVYRVRHIPTGKYFGAYNSRSDQGKIYTRVGPAKALRTNLTKLRFGWQPLFPPDDVEVVEFSLFETTGRFDKPCLNKWCAERGITCGVYCTSDFCQAEPT